MARTKVVAFADDLIMATRGDSVRTGEIYVNVELSKKMGGQRATGLNSMIIMLHSRMKRK